MITTYNKFDGQQYIVDQSVSDTSFIALTGKIDAVGGIEVDNPTNAALDAVYTMTFTLEDAIPKSGYVQIQLPEGVTLEKSTTLSTGSCRDFTCWEVTQNSIKFLITDGLPAGTQNVIKIGGVTNPRSFKPTAEFFMQTLDIDGVAPIDDGYKIGVTMTKAGEIESFSVS